MKRLLFLLVLGFVVTLLAARPWRRLSGLLTGPGASSGQVRTMGPMPRLLFLLPLPVALAALVSMARGQLLPMLGDMLGYALFLAAALVMRQGLTAEGRDESGHWPLKTLGGLLTALATGLTVWLGVGRNPAVAAVFAVVAFAGCILTYGGDLRRSSFKSSGRRQSSQARAALDEAARSLAAIEQDRRDIRQPELDARLRRVLALADAILKRLEEDPRDLHRARKFLNVYLEGVQRVVEGYARTHGRVTAPELDERFRKALAMIEEVFREQEQRLLESDVEDLDVQIEVLMRQLEEEGLR